ncbi:MAG: alpha-galactosidase [Gemmatimonadales bacterium]
MQRRDLLEMLAAGSLAPLRTSARRAHGPPEFQSAGDAWHFDLDSRHRWSLSRGRESAMRGLEIAIELDNAAPVPLSALTDVRTFRSGARHRGAWNVVGRAGNVEVTARLEDGESPLITVQLRGLDLPRGLVAVHFTRGHSIAQPKAWINGYQSWSACNIVPVDARTAASGHWQLALIGGARAGAGIALSFGENDGGAGEFHITGRALDALARFERRPVSADHPPAVASLTIIPSADALATLGALAATGAAGSLKTAAPAGWCSWYELYARVTEEDVAANIAVARERFDPRAFRFIQLDDGYQRAAGDWETNEKFPHGHRWLTDHIHEAGFQAGLWMAPFAVTNPSGLPTARAEWLLLGEGGQPAPMDDQPHWGGLSYALDASLRDVQDWLRELARHAVTEWGYDYLKLDFLHYGARGRPKGGASPHEALRAGLRALREGAGRAYLLGCGAPLQSSLGLFDGMRIGSDVDATWSGVAPGARAAMQRAHYQGLAWHNDPDALVVRAPLSLNEARAWTSIVALSGGVTMASDHLPRLTADRIELLQRAMPVANVAGRALDLLKTEPALAPALVEGGRVLVALPGRWRFQEGDAPSGAAVDIDDGTWSEIDVGTNWERAGHEGLDGFAWYRKSFMAPRRPAAAGPIALELGRIDDADETFINGVKIGASGAMPPRYESAWDTWRRYTVPDDVVRWGKQNIVAVRVYDGGGPGGYWSLTRNRPPSQVLARTSPERWMLALVNWDDEPRRENVDLAAHGAGGPFAAYDVWREERASDVSGHLSVTIQPHSAIVLGLVRPRATPFVLGSTRHIVQGAIDIAEERWESRARRLSGRSTNLDGRPYAITVALPRGFTPKSCAGGSGACTLARQAYGAVRVEFAAGRNDLDWSVEF